MSFEAPGNKSHLERLMTGFAKQPGTPSEKRIRRLVGLSVVTSMLEILATEQPGCLVIKGGASMEIRFGPSVRSTQDIDAATPADIGQTLSLISKTLATGGTVSQEQLPIQTKSEFQE